MKKRKTAKDFDYYIGEYMYWCHSRRLRPKTMQSYEQTLRLFERWCKEEAGIEEPAQVQDSVIRHYICSLQERGKYTFYAVESRKETNYPEHRPDYRKEVSVTTINNYLRNLKAFFAWYAEENGTENPMERVHLLKNERKPQEFLEDSEIQKIAKVFDLSSFPEHRDYTIIMVLLDTGMRIGECLKIRTEDVNMVERTIALSAENTKGRKSRVVFFSVKATRLLQRWLRFKDRYCESELLFPIKSGTPLAVSNFETNFRKYLSRAGINKDVSPHVLRNNFAKRCLMNGLDIFTLSKILGHSSVEVTEKAYMDLTDSDLRHRYQSFSPLENMKG